MKGKEMSAKSVRTFTVYLLDEKGQQFQAWIDVDVANLTAWQAEDKASRQAEDRFQMRVDFVQ